MFSSFLSWSFDFWRREGWEGQEGEVSPWDSLVYVHHDARFLDFCRSSSSRRMKERENSGSSLLSLCPGQCDFSSPHFKPSFVCFIQIPSVVSVHRKRNRRKTFYSTLHRAVNKNIDKIRAINHNNIWGFQASFLSQFILLLGKRCLILQGLQVAAGAWSSEFQACRHESLSLALSPFIFSSKLVFLTDLCMST